MSTDLRHRCRHVFSAVGTVIIVLSAKTLDGPVRADLAEGFEVLERAGHTDWCLNAGGDVLVSGRQADGAP